MKKLLEILVGISALCVLQVNGADFFSGVKQKVGTLKSKVFKSPSWADVQEADNRIQVAKTNRVNAARQAHQDELTALAQTYSYIPAQTLKELQDLAVAAQEATNKVEVANKLLQQIAAETDGRKAFLLENSFVRAFHVSPNATGLDELATDEVNAKNNLLEAKRQLDEFYAGNPVAPRPQPRRNPGVPRPQ